MVLNNPLTIMLVGFFGGALTELLHWWNLRTHEDLPHYRKSVFYWAITLAMVLAGGFVAWLYFGSNAEAIIVLHIGVSTPLLLQKMVSSLPDRNQEGKRRMPQSKPPIRNFFKW